MHVTVPRTMRWLRPPDEVILHTVLHPLSLNEIVLLYGMRVTAPLRTLLDVAEAGTAPDQVARPVQNALTRGLLTAASVRAAQRTRGDRVASWGTPLTDSWSTMGNTRLHDVPKRQSLSGGP